MLIIVAEIINNISLWNIHSIVYVSRVWINRSVEIGQALFNIFYEIWEKPRDKSENYKNPGRFL